MKASDVALRGRMLVAGEVVTRGAKGVEEFRTGRRRVIRGTTPKGRFFELIVKVRRRGDWQGSTADGDPSMASTSTFWVFVDLSSDTEGPRFFVAPDHWVRSDIEQDHAAYLEKHGGRRAESQESVHHAIEPWRVAPWENRWDLLDLV